MYRRGGHVHYFIKCTSTYRHPGAGERCSVPATMSFIKRIRRSLHPPVPRTIAELGDVLRDYAPARAIYRGTVTAGGASAIIFASHEMLKFLKRARWLHIDGTFSVSDFFLVLDKMKAPAFEAWIINNKSMFYIWAIWRPAIFS